MAHKADPRDLDTFNDQFAEQADDSDRLFRMVAEQIRKAKVHLDLALIGCGDEDVENPVPKPSPTPPATPDEIVVTVYTDDQYNADAKPMWVNVIIPADLWFSLGAGERDEMTADIMNAIGPWMDDKARVRVDAGSDLV